jgi:molybdate transport system substrate-binding protein
MRQVAVVGAALLLAGCGSSHSSGSNQNQTLTVFAAASLQHVFTSLGTQFSAAHPGVKVDFSFGGSSQLAEQIDQGAPADVFASADVANMQTVVKAGQISGQPTVFAKNTLVIVTAPGNPKHIASLGDLARPGIDLVVCAVPVPCGTAAGRVEARAGVTLKPVSEEPDVTSVLTKVVTGQADAGLVYVTDARGVGSKVTEVDFPEAAGAVNSYPIAGVASSAHQDLVRQFEAFVIGPTGRSALSAAGFQLP